MPQNDFSTRLIRWQKQHGRNNLPWQTRDPYRIWLSEIMLQQTQVATVLNYYPRFVAAFPNVHALANANLDSVLALWQGLGYYSRARNLHKAAKQIVNEFGGEFPISRLELATLCGVGRSTAAAIAAFAFHQRETILDGNVKRVLCRVFAEDGNPTDKKFEQHLWQLAESLLPQSNSDMPAYTQGLMDLGATVCKRTRPLCDQCPLNTICQAKMQNRIADLPRKKAPPTVQNLPLYWLLLLRSDGALLLEKRPSKGIWGGLYCVPCFEYLQYLYDFAQSLGIFSDGLTELNSVTHRLTHRLLLITPFSARASQPDLLVPITDNCVWVEPQNLVDYGIPKPLANLLASHQATLF